MVAKRFDVHLINLDPTIGSEIKKTRPCLIISPDEMNRYINTVIAVPMTTEGTSYPSITTKPGTGGSSVGPANQVTAGG